MINKSTVLIQYGTPREGAIRLISRSDQREKTQSIYLRGPYTSFEKFIGSDGREKVYFLGLKNDTTVLYRLCISTKEFTVIWSSKQENVDAVMDVKQRIVIIEPTSDRTKMQVFSLNPKDKKKQSIGKIRFLEIAGRSLITKENILYAYDKKYGKLVRVLLSRDSAPSV